MPAKPIASPSRDREPGIATRTSVPSARARISWKVMYDCVLMSSRGITRRGDSARSGRFHRSHQTRTPKNPRKKTTNAATPAAMPSTFGMSLSATGSQQGPSDEDVSEAHERRSDANASYRLGRWHEDPEGPSTDLEDLGIRVALTSCPKEQSFDGHLRSAGAAENIRLARAPIGAGPPPLAC